MGAPIARHLASSGHSVTVQNRSKGKALDWVRQNGGAASDTAANAARGCDFAILCVGNDADLLDVTTGAGGVLSTLDPGSVIIDHTTASAKASRHVYSQAKLKEISFIDAPVSGGQAGAEKGLLTVMCGGDPQAFDRASLVMQSYSQACRLMGPSGSGQLTKMMNQICIASIVEGMAESIQFGRSAGLDVAQAIEVISGGAAGSWQLRNRGRDMLAGNYGSGFAVDWMRKDLGIALDEARRNGACLPVTALVDQFFSDIQSMGGGRWDTTSLIARLARK